jgi:hypothetical protein
MNMVHDRMEAGVPARLDGRDTHVAVFHPREPIETNFPEHDGESACKMFLPWFGRHLRWQVAAWCGKIELL